MNLELISEMWTKDSVIDDIELDKASLKIPQLHSKYLTLLNEFKLLQKKTQLDLKKLEHKKWLYYSGRAVPEDYEEEPFNHKVMKSDVPRWVEVDDQVSTLQMKVEYYEVLLNTLSEILKQVSQMSFNIKNTIEWRKFVSGS